MTGGLSVFLFESKKYDAVKGKEAEASPGLSLTPGPNMVNMRAAVFPPIEMPLHVIVKVTLR